jgi:hypothetical protein
MGPNERRNYGTQSIKKLLQPSISSDFELEIEEENYVKWQGGKEDETS